jgi:predicted methyltransferase/thiol-disulfide isomerase/thioredoxin
MKTSIEVMTSSHGSRETHLSEAKKLRDEFSSDYFAHRHYQEQFVSQGLFNKEVQQEYRALMDAHPDETLYTLLYARTLKGTNTPELIKLLDRALERDPGNVQAHLKLVEVYSAPAFLDNAKLKVHADAYWKGCPTSLEGYTLVQHVEGREFAAETAARLRPLLESRNDQRWLGLYTTLWALEFKSVPLSAQDPVRERIRKDVERLRALDSKQPYVLNELRQGYETLGDQEGVKWATDQMPKNAGGPSEAQRAISDWRRANPQGSSREVFNEKLLKQTEEWIRQWPDDPQPRYERFQTLQFADATPLDDIVIAAEDWIRVYEKHPGSMVPYLQVAYMYDRFHIRYAEIPSLLDRLLKQDHSPLPAPPASDLFPATSRNRMDPNLSNWISAAGLYLKVKKYDRARELLDKVTAAGYPPPETEKPNNSNAWSYWTNMAKLARVDGRKMDALTYERNAMFANQFSNPDSERYQKASLLQDWKELKGNDEGFEAFMTRPGSKPAAPKTTTATVAPMQSGWAKLDKNLPDFEMEDAVGKTWHLADLKGKVTLVNLWATWCGPCKEELPHLQTLYNKVRERKDLAVLTLNTDDNLGLIVPFLKEHHYTFPVLAAGDYVHKLVPELSIPRNWIVTGDGVLRLEKIGFGGGASQWAEEMIADMEKAAAPIAAAGQGEHQHHPPSDPAAYARILEDPSRDAWQKPHEVITGLEIKPEEVIADLGSGSGYFTRRLAMHAAKVYAIDIDAGLLNILKKDAPANVETVLAAPDDPKLAPESVDTVFICEVLHHIENRPAYLAKLTKALKPGGRIVVVDFIKDKKTHGPPEEMKLSEDHVRQEFASAGFKQAQSFNFLPEQYFLIFKR